MTDKRNGHLSALVTGAVLGAGAVALAHKPTRMRIKRALENAVAEGEEKLDTVRDESRKRVIKNLKTAQRKLETGR